jgi:hypothetical protein
MTNETKQLIRSLIDAIDLARERVTECERDYAIASQHHSDLLAKPEPDLERLSRSNIRLRDVTLRWNDASVKLDDLQTQLDLLLS